MPLRIADADKKGTSLMSVRVEIYEEGQQEPSYEIVLPAMVRFGEFLSIHESNTGNNYRAVVDRVGYYITDSGGVTVSDKAWAVVKFDS